MVVAGIDLGSTHGCVGVWHNGKVNIIANDQGFRTTPAYICFEDDEVIIGDTAVNKLHTHAENTVFHLKRVLGKTHEEVNERDFVTEWSFNISQDDNGHIQATTSRKGAPHKISVVEFCTLLIQNLKELAQDFTGETVEDIVMTLPAHNFESQKAIVEKAAKAANVNVLSYLSEPIAAAIAYGLDMNSQQDAPEYVLVFDLGGATYDLTLMTVDKGLFDIIATTGKDTLGGENFTDALVEHCAKSYERRSKLKVKESKKALSRLRLACETAKRGLSTQASVNVELDSLMEGEDLSLKISRARFEELIADYIAIAMKDIDTLLDNENLEKEDIDHVILVGGSSRIPILVENIQKAFQGKTTHLHLSPDEVVAHGATIEASCQVEIMNAEVSETQDMVNCVPLTLSVGLANGSVSELIHRHTVLPARASEVYTSSEDQQTEFFLEIYEGQRLMKKDNTLLAQVAIKGVTPLPKGEAEITVDFTVSSKGVLSVVATETSNKPGSPPVSKTLEVKMDAGRLSPDDVATIVKNAEDAAEEDDDLLEELEAQAVTAAQAATPIVETEAAPTEKIAITQDLD